MSEREQDLPSRIYGQPEALEDISHGLPGQTVVQIPRLRFPKLYTFTDVRGKPMLTVVEDNLEDPDNMRDLGEKVGSRSWWHRINEDQKMGKREMQIKLVAGAIIITTVAVGTGFEVTRHGKDLKYLRRLLSDWEVWKEWETFWNEHVLKKPPKKSK